MSFKTDKRFMFLMIYLDKIKKKDDGSVDNMCSYQHVIFLVLDVNWQ